MIIAALSFFNCNINSFKSWNNQECKIRPETVDVSSNEPVFFYLIVLKQVNIVVVVITLTIHLQSYVFLMLLKTWTEKYSI